MRIGPMRHRLVIERQDDSTDTWGDPQVTQTVIATVWADIRHLKGEELFGAMQVESHLTHRIYLRYQTALKPMATMTAKWRGRMSNYDSPETFRVFDFESVGNFDEKNRTIEVMAREYVGGVSAAFIADEYGAGFGAGFS